MNCQIKNLIKYETFLPDVLDGEKCDKTKRYRIPKYQRHYDWEEENVINLYDDIEEAIRIKKPHYTGSFLLTNDEPAYIIDGQQRAITTFLLLKAFYLLCETTSIKNEIKSIFFVNPNEISEDTIRLIVSDQDKECFHNIIFSERYDDIEKSTKRMFLNFKLGYDFFEKILKHYSEKDIFECGFKSLQICELIIEKNIDDEAQKIFRDLNSKGQALKNSDLIRNYLLMTNPNLYGLWTKIEKNFKVNDEFQSDLFEEFIFNYVLMKKPIKINDNKIFNCYVDYCERDSDEFSPNGFFDRESAVRDLFKYSNYYKLFLNINIQDPDAKKYESTINLFKELRDMKQTTAYPFLMRVLDDEANGDIDVSGLNEIVNLVVVYYVRAVFANISSSSRRSYFLTMYKNIFETVKDNKKKYYQSIYKYITQIGTGSKMPSSKEFAKSIIDFDIYPKTEVCRHLLKTIVNNRYPNEYTEKLAIEKPTIEHYLPQHPDVEWKKELGGQKKLDEAMKYLDTIGNLSLADGGKNSALGNKSKKEKIKILKDPKYSHVLDDLNKDFIGLEKEKFTLDFIKKRGNKLAKIIFDRFKIDESINTKGIYFDEYDVVFGRTDSNGELVNRVPAYIEINDKSIAVQDFKKVGSEMFYYFGEHYPDELKQLALASPQYKMRPILELSTVTPKYYQKIASAPVNYRLETGGPIFYSACIVAKELGINLNNIRLLLKKQAIDKNDLEFETTDDLDTLKIEQYNNKMLCVAKKDEILAKGYLLDKKIVVLKGSRIEPETKDYLNDCFVAVRNKLIKEGIVNERFEFSTNCVFNSKSAASTAVLGRNSNGNDDWKPYIETQKRINQRYHYKFDREIISVAIAEHLRKKENIILLPGSNSYIRWTTPYLRNVVGLLGDGTWAGFNDLIAYEIRVMDKTKIHLSIYIGPGKIEYREEWTLFAHNHRPPFRFLVPKPSGGWKLVYRQELLDTEQYTDINKVVEDTLKAIDGWLCNEEPKFKEVFEKASK